MLHLLKYIPVTVMEERYVMLILTIEDQTVVDRKGFKSSEFGLFTSLHVFDMERPSSSNRTIAPVHDVLARSCDSLGIADSTKRIPGSAQRQTRPRSDECYISSLRLVVCIPR